MTELFDPGLQPERTELAWRRTALALGAGSIVAMRLIPAAFGSGWWILVGAAGLVMSGISWLWARRRYRAFNDTLARDGDRGRMPGARPLLALTLFTLGAAILSFAVVITVAVS
ncbi:DUF202 domain-containing protein [Microbacterium sp. LWS13-1.2]|uniref:DUF202 domain-containing protein n=1 Tax=Microbacterium sp. LWS13-1.2 TaxID=3135264 RepID=A0AAU6S9J0_9MICO